MPWLHMATYSSVPSVATQPAYTDLRSVNPGVIFNDFSLHTFVYAISTPHPQFQQLAPLGEILLLSLPTYVCLGSLTRSETSSLSALFKSNSNSFSRVQSRFLPVPVRKMSSVTPNEPTGLIAKEGIASVNDFTVSSTTF
ncbi:hypothetical protein OCU04_002443 [Sclerotinia nivalis]|uniref:Uncharacterized protein n=1 Tax=Sclerotinia nivalis TaxID=352851 RepID=A0A9X0DM66_9HELO|nr:hypothetical protein OCU04_002443 [Sclerotinia nivalis]